MSDPVTGTGGGDRAVARALAGVAAAAPVRPVQPSTTLRDPQVPPAAADITSAGGLAASLASKPPINAERVAQIKKAIANGTFPILPATIADRLLALRYDWIGHDS